MMNPKTLKQFIVVYLPNVEERALCKAQNTLAILNRHYHLREAEYWMLYQDISETFWHEVATNLRWRRPRPRSTRLLIRIAAFEKEDDCRAHRKATENLFNMCHLSVLHRRSFVTSVVVKQIRSELERNARWELKQHAPTLN